MKSIIVLLIISGLMVLASCSSKTAKDQQHIKGISPDSQQVSIPKAPPKTPSQTTIQENRSEVLAEFIEKHQRGEADFSIIAKVLEVKEAPSYPSIATAGNAYELYPNFALGEKKEIMDTPGNKKLKQLRNLKKGDNFKAIIFLDDNRQWMIQEVIDK